MCMKSMLKVVFKSFIIFTLFFTPSLVVGQKILYTYAQNVEPKFMLSGSNITGFCHDILTELNKELKAYNIRIEYKTSKPKKISEIFDAIRKDEIQIFIGAAHSEERERNVNYIKTPLYGLREVLLVEKGTKDVFFEKNHVRIGVIGGTVTSSDVPKVGVSQEIEVFKSLNEAIEALDEKRIDGVFYSSLTLGYVIEKSKGKYDFLNQAIKKYYHYIILSKNIDKQTTEKIENALKNLHRKGILENLIKKYNLQRYVLPGNVVEILIVDWKPYEWYDEKAKKWIGPDVDVVRAVLEKIGYKPAFLTFPWSRCEELAKAGVYDAMMSVSLTKEREALFVYPKEPLSTGKSVLFKLKSSNIDINTLESIPVTVRCGYCDSYGYPEWFWNANFKKVVLTTDEVGFKLLKDGKIDIFISNLFVGKYLSKELNIELEWSPAFGGSDNYYLAFSKGYHGENLALAFSDELSRFKKAKEYIDILQKYGFSYEDFWK